MSTTEFNRSTPQGADGQGGTTAAAADYLSAYRAQEPLQLYDDGCVAAVLIVAIGVGTGRRMVAAMSHSVTHHAPPPAPVAQAPQQPAAPPAQVAAAAPAPTQVASPAVTPEAAPVHHDRVRVAAVQHVRRAGAPSARDLGEDASNYAPPARVQAPPPATTATAPTASAASSAAAPAASVDAPARRPRRPCRRPAPRREPSSCRNPAPAIATPAQ